VSVIRKRGKDFGAIVFLVVLALLVSSYILHQERLRFPWEAAPFKLKAEFSTGQAVTPGQGQTVRVSGVRIGDISKVDLLDGRAVVSMDIDQQYKRVVHTDATALLRPKTGLKDMFIELDPGTKRAPVASENWTMPVRNTQPDVNLDEIFQALDADSRAYLGLLVNGAGRGLANRGGDLAEVFRRFEPTHYELARLSGAVRTRRVALRRLVSSLAQLNGALGGKKQELSELVDSSSAVFRSFAAENTSISRAVGDLPGALRQTTSTLTKVQALATTLGPAAQHLLPAARAIDPANRAVAPFARATAPVVQNQIRPFVVAARPLVRSLRPASANLAAATPDLRRSFVVLNHLFNDLAYNPNGREDPSLATRQEGYLFWIAWIDHQGLQLFSSNDANGGYRPLFLSASCATFRQIVDNQPGVPPAVQGLLTGFGQIVGEAGTGNTGVCPPTRAK